MAHRLKTLHPRFKPLGQRAHGWAQTTTDGTTARGYGWAWQQLRERILQRDCGLCCVCRKEGRFTLASEVDHITRKASGGTDDDDNLQSICKACHSAKTVAENGRTQRAAIGVDGWPLKD